MLALLLALQKVSYSNCSDLMPMSEWFFIIRSILLMKSNPSVPIQNIRLGRCCQERRKARDTHAARAASLNGIRECIWHQMSSGRLGPEYLVLLSPSEFATCWQSDPFLLATESIEPLRARICRCRRRRFRSFGTDMSRFRSSSFPITTTIPRSDRTSEKSTAPL